MPYHNRDRKPLNAELNPLQFGVLRTEMVGKEQNPNVERLMRIWKAFNENDLEAIAQMVDGEIVYRVSGRGPL